MTEQGGSEKAAIQILTRAVQLDSEQKFSESLTCYEQGIRLLLEAVKEVSTEEKKKHFRKKADEYLARAEKVKQAARKHAAAMEHKQIHIKDGDTGWSYTKVFAPLLDEFLREVVVHDAYIRSTHQVYNFLHFCELIVKMSPNIKRILLNTTEDPENNRLQSDRLTELASSLKNHKVDLKINFSSTLHDREIRFDNGWVVKIGRGLDYFKRANGRFSIGWGDYDLRACHQTTIDIFHSTSIK